tara:strand:- start:239 stop:352 length:114 start_codon:yes stop_codon:yes gene_type:complete
MAKKYYTKVLKLLVQFGKLLEIKKNNIINSTKKKNKS